LYGYIDKLQNNKADKDDITSSMDVKADKQALDSKVFTLFHLFHVEYRVRLSYGIFSARLKSIDNYLCVTFIWECWRNWL